MILNQAALKRSSTVLVLVLFIVIAGAMCYNSLPREDSPDITIPYIFVTTTYEGVAPSDMETLVTIPLERKLKGLSDLKELTSRSDDGISSITIEFTPGTDIDDALQKVREKVDQAEPDLPADLPDDPVITEMNFSDRPIINVVLSGPFSLKRLKVFAEDFEDSIESIPGVLDAEIIGGLEREIHVEFDMDRVAFYNVPFSSLLNSVRNANVNMPGGSMDIGKAKYLVRVPEEYERPDEIESIVAFVRDGKPVYLRDLAEIRDHYKDPTDRSRLNGENSVTIEVTKRSGENIIRIIDAMKAELVKIRAGFPPDLTISMTSDESVRIRRMVADLENNIISGLLLVLAVVLIFIGGRSAAFVAMSIPLSMLLTFIVLSAIGVTLNIVVLFSLTLALGMLVDNGIVIVENIYRHIQEGKSRRQAASDAVDEVAWPVISSTLTTVGAFFPLLFWPGIMGEFMSYLPLTVIIALLSSLFVALVVNPVFSAYWQTVKSVEKPGLIDRMLNRLRDSYGRILVVALNWRLSVVFGAFALLIASIVAFGKFGAGVEFFPDTEPQRAVVYLKAPVGTNLDATDEVVKIVERVVSQYPDIEYTIAKPGASSREDGNGTHLAQITLDFVDFHDRSRPSSEILNEVRTKLLAQIKGVEVRVEKERRGPPTGKPVNMEIAGKDMKTLGEIAADIRSRISDIPGLVDLKDNYVQGKPEIVVDVDKEKAALLDLDTYTIANTVKAAFNGIKVGVYREGKDDYDIVARLPKKDRTSLESVRRLTVSGPNGVPVPLTSLAEVRLSGGLGGINRIDQKRVITVSADVAGALANNVLAEIRHRLADYPLPGGYTISYTGEQEDQQEASDFLAHAFMATVFIIFLVLITQFNSVMTPFIILTSVALSLIGVFLGLIITGMPFGVIMTGVGVISLAGVVVNNAIVLIDCFNQLKEEGLKVNEALFKAGMLRFRPVLLTAITTVLGLLPMATGISFDFLNFRWDVGGESAQMWGPMAVAVIFGLSVATILTLVVVPVLCSLSDGLVARMTGRKSGSGVEEPEAGCS